MNDRCRNYSSGRGSCPVGSRTRDKFVKDRTTNPPTLRKVGETDQYGLIQSFKDECDVNRIVARYQAGDTSVLQRVQGLYYDATQLPTEQTEMMNLSALARESWENLPDDFKAKFNNDKEAFVNALFAPPADQPAGEAPPQETIPAEGGTDE